jgi:hypothetical protein
MAGVAPLIWQHEPSAAIPAGAHICAMLWQQGGTPGSCADGRQADAGAAVQRAAANSTSHPILLRQLMAFLTTYCKHLPQLVQRL